jgi:hypothetical protein
MMKKALRLMRSPQEAEAVPHAPGVTVKALKEADLRQLSLWRQSKVDHEHRKAG